MKDRDKTKKQLAQLRQRVKELEEAKARLKDYERQTQAANALLRLYAIATSRTEYMGLAVKLINIWSDCRYVGIRMLNIDGFIPYESYLGFSREFWESENWLSIYKDQCACIRVITGNPEPQDISVMTPGGSFYLDNFSEFLESLPAGQRARFRGVCIKCGFKSVAIIPLPFQGKILGVIHIADEQGGKVTRPLVEFLESVAFFLGQGSQKFSKTPDEQVLTAHLHMLMESSQHCVSLLSREGKYLELNTAGYLLHRFASPQAVLGKSFSANMVDDPEEVAAAVQRAATGEEVYLQYKSLDVSGREVCWDARLTPVKGTDGSITGILSIAREINAPARQPVVTA
jgi:PAS domain S-box-containing protein